MIDREKVIKGLECCIPMTERNGIGDCCNCPYDRKITFEGGVTECCHDLFTDALALLKAQEPVEPKRMRDAPREPLRCGNCGAMIVIFSDYTAKYCCKCGRAVKWE